MIQLPVFMLKHYTVVPTCGSSFKWFGAIKCIFLLVAYKGPNLCFTVEFIYAVVGIIIVKGKDPEMFNFVCCHHPESQSFSEQLDSRWPRLLLPPAAAC